MSALSPDSLSTVAEALAALALSGLPALEARMLVSHATGLSRVQLITQDTYALPADTRTVSRYFSASELLSAPVARLRTSRDWITLHW